MQGTCAGGRGGRPVRLDDERQSDAAVRGWRRWPGRRRAPHRGSQQHGVEGHHVGRRLAGQLRRCPRAPASPRSADPPPAACAPPVRYLPPGDAHTSPPADAAGSSSHLPEVCIALCTRAHGVTVMQCCLRAQGPNAGFTTRRDRAGTRVAQRPATTGPANVFSLLDGDGSGEHRLALIPACRDPASVTSGTSAGLCVPIDAPQLYRAVHPTLSQSLKATFSWVLGGWDQTKATMRPCSLPGTDWTTSMSGTHTRLQSSSGQQVRRGRPRTGAR